MPKRVDANQSEIVKVFRSFGYTVQTLHTVGKGCPDILVGNAGGNFLVEIKDGSKFPSQRKLTPDEKEWHENWRGQVVIIESIKDVMAFHVEQVSKKLKRIGAKYET